MQADPTRLRQLLTNVLDNAVRHSPEGGRVRVGCQVTDVRWLLDVADDGPGVAPADRERAFERFGTLADPAEGAATGGTGLGLAIARWVATLHGGAVRFADPPPGASGALLRIDLPLTPPARPSPQSAHHDPSGGPGAHQPAQPARRRLRRRSTRATPARPSRPRPVLEPLFGRFWPDVPGGSRALVLAAAGVGVLAGLVLPNHSAGLALFLVVVAAGITVAYAARHKRDPFTLTCLVLAALCTLPVLLRDAPWIGVLCLLAGATALIAGVVRVHRVPEFVLAGLAWPLAGIRDLPWLGRSLRDLTGQARAPRVLVTALWSVLAVLVFGLLFVSADAIVESWVDAVLPDISVDSVVLRVFIAVAIAGPTLAAAYLALNPPRTEDYGVLPRAAVAHRFEWLVPVLLVDAVFAVFVAAQLSVFFGGHGYVQRTTGLTYADYVHQGFGQLTVATLLTLLVVWAASHWAGDRVGDRVWLRVLAGCAVRPDPGGGRLGALPDAPLPGGLRLHPAPAAGGRLRGLARRPGGRGGGRRASCAGASGCRASRWSAASSRCSGIAAINPDAWIAEQNLDRYADTGRVDWHFLRNLSADAVPVFEDRAETEVSCGMPRYWSQDDDWLVLEPGPEPATSAIDDGPEGMAAALATAQPTRTTSRRDCRKAPLTPTR